ncbi:MAG TPA: universal stress protein [Methylomirabilota bacterium]|nr:universal stress protein [Methylomirabilota bacterium]
MTKRTAKKPSRRRANFRTILVPVDFSKCSRASLDYARQFAAQHGSELILLHVVEPIAYPTELGFPSLGAIPPHSDYERAGRKHLAQWHKEMAGSGAKVNAKLRVGQPYFEITRAAKELAVDLIIISTHGHTGLKHVFLGSTAERVVRHAECPVLTLRCRK